MSRKLSDLRPDMRDIVERMLATSEKHDIDLLVTCTLRTNEEQAVLYRQGRTLAQIDFKASELEDVYDRTDLATILRSARTPEGRIVTNAGPGQSLHQYGLAIDCVPMVAGKPMWDSDSPLWAVYGALCKGFGLEWAGTWIKFKEYPHAQLPGVDWKAMIRK